MFGENICTWNISTSANLELLGEDGLSLVQIRPGDRPAVLAAVANPAPSHPNSVTKHLSTG